MDVEKNYRMHHLAYQLISTGDFEVLHYNENEIWLEKLAGKTSRVVRLFQGGFDWKTT